MFKKIFRRKVVVAIAISVLAVYPLWLGIPWLFNGIIILLGVYLFSKAPWKIARWFTAHKHLSWIYYLIIPIVFSLLTRIFILEICIVPSPSMEKWKFLGYMPYTF